MPPRLRVVPDLDAAPLRALIYARTSDDKKQRGKSTDSQVRSCQDECETNGWKVVDTVVDDGMSASALARKRRERWEEVVEAIAADKFDVLVVWDFSRTTRDLEVFVKLRAALRKHGVLLSYKGNVYDLRKANDRRRVSHDAVDAEAESGETSERVLRNKARDAADGWPHGPVPYGYRRVYNPRTGVLERQEPDEDDDGCLDGVPTAPIVREIVSRFLDGASLSQLARDMTRRGLSTPKPPRDRERAKGWTAATVGQLLRQPSIAGLRKHARPGEDVEYYEASWDPIITQEQRAQILTILSDPSRVVHRGTEPTHLLSHLARCASCKVPVRHATKRQNGVRYAAYSCNKAECKAPVYCQAPPADDLVTQAVLAVMGNPVSVAVLTGSVATQAASVVTVRQRIAELNEQLADLDARLKAGNVSHGRWAEAASDLDEQIAAARGELAPRTTGKTVLRLATAEDQLATWESFTVAERREVVRATFEVLLHPAAVKGQRRWDPQRVELIPRAR